MPPQSCSCSDLIAVLIFLKEFKNACYLSCFPEPIAVRCFQFCVEEQAELLLHTQLMKSLTAVDFKRSRMLCSHGDVMNFLFRTYAKSAVIAELYTDVFNLPQTSGMTEMIYFRLLWYKAFGCKTVQFNKEFKSLFIYELFPRTRAQVRHFFATNRQLLNHKAVQQAHALSTSVRVAGWPAATASAI